MIKKINIPNPTKLTEAEYVFLSKDINFEPKYVKPKFKGRMISMSDDFYQQLNNFLRSNPVEGSRSAFIVRVVSEYMKNKTTTN